MGNFKLPSWKEKGGHHSSFGVGVNHRTCSWRRRKTAACSVKTALQLFKEKKSISLYIYIHMVIGLFFLAWNKLVVGTRVSGIMDLPHRLM